MARTEAKTQASKSSNTRHDDELFGASRKQQLRNTLEKSRRALVNASILSPPPRGSLSQLASFGQTPTRSTAFTPLKNCGNTCFLNSVLQCLRAVCDRLGIAVPVADTCPVFRLLVVPLGAHDNFESRVRSLPLWRDLALGVQHDAHEALRLLLDKDHAIHSHCTSQACFARRMQDVCAVNVHTHLSFTRSACTWYCDPPPEPGLDISVAVKPANLQSLLADFQMPEFLAAQDDYTCTACGDLVQKTLQVQPVGRALLFHLKRFDSRGRKLDDIVTFPRELIFGTVRYEFAAVVEHQGRTLKAGHYVAHVQSRKLLCCNDDTVRETTWEGIASRQAYVLAYVRTEH